LFKGGQGHNANERPKGLLSHCFLATATLSALVDLDAVFFPASADGVEKLLEDLLALIWKTHFLRLSSLSTELWV
jgi:hypothetical protein